MEKERLELEDLKQIAGGELTDSNKRSLWSWCVYWKNEKHMSLLDVLSSMNLSAEQADYIKSIWGSI